MGKRVECTLKMEERIDNYIRGLMTPQEEQQFLADCKSDSVLRREAIMTAYLVKGVKAVHDEQMKK